MAVLPIIKIGHPTLRKVADKVEKFDQELQDFMDDLVETGQADNRILHFEFIEGVEDARRYLGCKVFFETDARQTDARQTDSRPADHLSQMVGYTLVDQKAGIRSTVEDYVSSEENPLLIIHYQGSEIMLPMHEDLIEAVDHADRVIYARIPDGLLDIN